MISIEEDKLNYPITIEIPIDYWVVTTVSGEEIEYNADN
tara:strand:+ start:581 stop:697 length:117 start_codon:yes stop_codon:yes gene_type:complete